MQSLFTYDKYEYVWTRVFTRTTASDTIFTILEDIIGEIPITSYTAYTTRFVDALRPFEPIYPYASESQIAALKGRIAGYLETRKVDLKKMYDAWSSNYKPLENYNMHEESKRTDNLNAKTDTTDSVYVAPDSAESYYNQGKTVLDGEVKNTGTQEFETDKSGNLGVTTSQQMLQSELDLRRVDFLEEYIINPIKVKFAVLVY